MSPSSASMSVASTRRSTFRPGTGVSSKSTTRRSPLPRTLILPQHSGASSSSKHAAASRVPTLLKLGSLGTSVTKVSADYDSVASRTGIKEMHQERNPSTVSQLLTRIQDLQNKVNSLSETREFYDPETASSSGATHVPSQPSTIPSPRTMPCRDSGLPDDAHYQLEKVEPPLSSTIQRIWHPLLKN